MKRFPIRLPNLSLSVIEEGGSRFFTLFTIYTCTCNAATIFWVTAGPSLNMEAAPVRTSSDHFPIVHEAGAVRGLDALSDTTIGTGLHFFKWSVSLPEEEPERADRLKSKALIES